MVASSITTAQVAARAGPHTPNAVPIIERDAHHTNPTRVLLAASFSENTPVAGCLTFVGTSGSHQETKSDSHVCEQLKSGVGMSYETQKPIDTTHYVARIVVERVNHKSVDARNGIAGAKTHEVKRTSTELAALTLKSDDLVTLVAKVGKHIDLVDDIDAEDVTRPKSMRGQE